MTDLLKALVPLVPYLVGVALLLLLALIVGFVVAPKRTRRTVNYVLNTVHEIREAKSLDPTVLIEVPDFETKQLPRTPDPRKSKETKP
jgi:hypothetical protein